MSSSGASRMVALKLYRSILRAHANHLPTPMRALGDAYVKSEFRLHKATTNTDQLSQFYTEWQKYLEHLQSTARARETVKSGVLDEGNATSSGNTTMEDARSAIRDRFGELGVEDVLRNIAGRHQGSVDEAYAALRDLGYSVTLTKFSAEDLQEGNGSNAVGRTMMFGEKHNSNFRPVYEQSAGLSNAVDEAVSNFGA